MLEGFIGRFINSKDIFVDLVTLVRNVKCVLVLAMLTTACGGGGGGSNSNSNSSSNTSNSNSSNAAPVADAGESQNIELSAYSYLTVELSGEASDSDGSIQTVKWEDKTTVAGQEVVELLNADKLLASFQFNNVNISEEQVYTFLLTVTDNDGATASDEVVVTIKPNKPIDVKLPDNIHGARLTQLSESKILISGGCKKLVAELEEASTLVYGCFEPSYQSFILDLNDASLQEVGDSLFARPYPLGRQSTTLLSDGRVVLYSQDNGQTVIKNGAKWDINFNEYGKHYGEIFDPTTVEFSQIPSMNMMRNFAMPALLSDDSLVFFSGTDHRIIEPGNVFSQHTNTIEMYNPVQESWEFSSAIYPEPFDEIVAITLPGNKVLLVGGRNVLGGGTNKAYVYDNALQAMTEIETYVPTGAAMYVNNNSGASVQRVELDDGSFCLVPQGSGWLIRFEPNSQTFNYDTSSCEQWSFVGGFVRDGDTLNNNKGLSGAAHVEMKPERVWVSQQIVDLNHVQATFNAEGGYYEFSEPMTIRIIK